MLFYCLITVHLQRIAKFSFFCLSKHTPARACDWHICLSAAVNGPLSFVFLFSIKVVGNPASNFVPLFSVATGSRVVLLSVECSLICALCTATTQTYPAYSAVSYRGQS